MYHVEVAVNQNKVHFNIGHIIDQCQIQFGLFHVVTVLQ